jgi:hypothetical protein
MSTSGNESILEHIRATGPPNPSGKIRGSQGGLMKISPKVHVSTRSAHLVFVPQIRQEDKGQIGVAGMSTKL